VDGQLDRLLIPPNFMEGDCARSEPMGLLYTPIAAACGEEKANVNDVSMLNINHDTFSGGELLARALPPVDLRAVC